MQISIPLSLLQLPRQSEKLGHQILMHDALVGQGTCVYQDQTLDQTLYLPHPIPGKEKSPYKHIASLNKEKQEDNSLESIFLELMQINISCVKFVDDYIVLLKVEHHIIISYG